MMKNDNMVDGLRALLIQKSIKLEKNGILQPYSLRALLIQKSIKLARYSVHDFIGLRALLIQKSIKPPVAREFQELLFESFVNSEEYQTSEGTMFPG